LARGSFKGLETGIFTHNRFAAVLVIGRGLWSKSG